MSVSINFTGGVAVDWMQVIPDSAANAMRELEESGASMDRFSAPSTHQQAPMLLLADIVDMLAQTEDHGIVLPKHWHDYDAIVPILPKSHGTYRIRVSTNPWAATVLSVNGVSVRTGETIIDQLLDDPRQNYWVGSFTVDGWVSEDSTFVMQFSRAQKGQEAGVVALQTDINPRGDAFDALTACFFVPKAMAKMMTVGRTPSSLGLESAAYSPLSQFEVARSAKSVGADDVPLSMAGGVILQNHPDNPLKSPDSFGEAPHASISVRMVNIPQYNELAKLVAAPTIEQSTLVAMLRSQRSYEETLLTELEIGKNKGTNMRRLPRIPTPVNAGSDDSGLEIMPAKGIPDTMLVAGINLE